MRAHCIHHYVVHRNITRNTRAPHVPTFTGAYVYTQYTFTYTITDGVRHAEAPALAYRNGVNAFLCSGKKLYTCIPIYVYEKEKKKIEREQ